MSCPGFCEELLEEKLLEREGFLFFSLPIFYLPRLVLLESKQGVPAPSLVGGTGRIADKSRGISGRNVWGILELYLATSLGEVNYNIGDVNDGL